MAQVSLSLSLSLSLPLSLSLVLCLFVCLPACLPVCGTLCGRLVVESFDTNDHAAFPTPLPLQPLFCCLPLLVPQMLQDSSAAKSF